MAKQEYIDFNYVKQHADFEKVLQHYNIRYKAHGDELRAPCPFHDDNNPSFSANRIENLFKCHASSCGAEGNILEFVAEMEDAPSLRDAAKQLAMISDIELAAPRRSKKSSWKGRAKNGSRNGDNRYDRAKIRGDRRWLKNAEQDDESGRAEDPQTNGSGAEAQMGQDERPETDRCNAPIDIKLKLDPNHPYGQERGFTPEIIEIYEMGYASRGMMANRWCVPFFNPVGQRVAYIGRWVDEERPEDVPRWKLPPGFNKSLELFNLHWSLHDDYMILVEGPFDAIRLHALHLPVVALLGTSVSDRQIELLAQHGVERITLMLDGGKEGRLATGRVLPRLAEHFFVRDAVLPDGDDPASAPEKVVLEHVSRVVGYG